MSSQTATELSAFSQHPEDVERRKRAYMEAIEPIHKRMAKLYAENASPTYVVITHSDGSGVTMKDDGLPEDAKLEICLLRRQIAGIAKSYGFEAPDQ